MVTLMDQIMSKEYDLENMSANTGAVAGLVTPLAAGILLSIGKRRTAAKFTIGGLIITLVCLAVSFGAFMLQTVDAADAQKSSHA